MSVVVVSSSQSLVHVPRPHSLITPQSHLYAQHPKTYIYIFKTQKHEIKRHPKSHTRTDNNVAEGSLDYANITMEYANPSKWFKSYPDFVFPNSQPQYRQILLRFSVYALTHTRRMQRKATSTLLCTISTTSNLTSIKSQHSSKYTQDDGREVGSWEGKQLC